MARRFIPVLLFSLMLTLLSVRGVSAHADLVSSVPAAGSTVATAPTKVTAVFDNESELRADGSSLRVTNAAGAVVDQDDSALDRADPARKTLVVSLQPNLPDGLYTVEWVAVSDADGEVEEGSFTFTVRTAQATTPTAGATAPPAATTAPAATPTAPTSLPATGDTGSAPMGVLLLTALLIALAGLALRHRAAR